jgi:hypothetical protein
MNPRIQRATNVQSLIFEICRDEEETIVGTVAVVMWFIWNNRNNWVWNEVKEPTRGIAMSALHLIREWRAVNVVQQQHIGTVGAPNSLQWQQPSEAWWKCNVDASFYGASGQTGWGGCVRNDH